MHGAHLVWMQGSHIQFECRFSHFVRLQGSQSVEKISNFKVTDQDIHLSFFHFSRIQIGGSPFHLKVLEERLGMSKVPFP